MVLLTAAYGAPYGPLRFSQWECVFNHGVAYGRLRRTLRTLTVFPMGMRFQPWFCLRPLTAHLTDPYGFPNGNAFSTIVLLTAAYGVPYGPLRFSQWEFVFSVFEGGGDTFLMILTRGGLQTSHMYKCIYNDFLLYTSPSPRD